MSRPDSAPDPGDPTRREAPPGPSAATRGRLCARRLRSPAACLALLSLAGAAACSTAAARADDASAPVSGSSAPQGGERRVRYEERPSPAPRVSPPPIERGDEIAAPEPSTIERDAVVADRFLAEGQSVEYAFECEPGELSIFLLSVFGYARGWESAATMQILDPAGSLRSQAQRSGGTVYEMFLAFEAVDPGVHRLVLRADEEFFRFVLERHSGYRARRAGDILEIGDRGLVHGYLEDADDRVVYALPVRAGHRYCVRVLATRERDRNRLRALRRRALERSLAAAANPDRPALRERAGRGMSLEQALTLPRFAVRAVADGMAVDPGGHYLSFQAPEDGEARIEVFATGGRDGGLFDLQVLRDPETIAVHGFLDDDEGEPISGMTLTFLLEPELDPVGETRTGSDGSWSLDVPPGDHSIVIEGTPEMGARRVRMRVDEPQEINLVYP